MKPYVRDFFREFFDLREGAERKQTIIDSIRDDTNYKGANLWILIFAIFICSIGLNINSIPIIIGAMLISPLMGPIVGVGTALAINDYKMLRHSARSLAIAAAIGAVVSTIYFLVTPIDNAQSELLARTQPTIFDVLIAFFGGLAGFIAASRKEKSNVLPGVAIATALMPPLCTIGFGIATLEPTFIFGAAYLFIINCIFICLATLSIARLLKLPRTKYIDEIQGQRVRRIITAVTIIVMIPAIFLAYTFVGRTNFNQNVDRFLAETFERNGHVIIYENILYDSSPRVIELAFLSTTFSEEQVNQFQSLLPLYDLDNTRLNILQDGFAISEDEWLEIVNDFRSEAERFEEIENRIERRIEDLRGGDRILEELQAIAPNVTNIALGTFADPVGGTDQLILVYENSSEPRLTEDERVKVRNWLITRLEDRNLQVQFLLGGE